MTDNMEIDITEPRGVKRKAPDRPPPRPPKRIKALDQDVVNKIAAGEIIVAPMHALKELIENAVDAGSTSLEIAVKDGGLKLLQITDNGHGINKDDMAILCERFTTSKLKTFEDLTSIGTYGFRGEALASISHIAHLTVTTKTADSSCAWRAHYADGKLVPAKPGQSADPKPIAGRGGTQITVEDLFYNIKQRRLAFRSHSEEYAKILDVVGRYAIHCERVAFSCKKHGDSAMGISVPSNATTVDRIRQIHGSAVASELVQFSVSDDKWGFQASGWTSNANYHVKKTTILLFINHRAVESSAIKKAIDQTYSTFLPKGGHPFTYLSLDIDPHRVDVNVHPTKREVNFLNEDEIIDSVCATISVQLAKVDTSRTFLTQTLLPGTRIPTISASSTPTPSNNARRSHTKEPTPTNPASTSTSTSRNDSTLIRTDSKLRKITSMLPSSHTGPSSLAYTHSPTRVPTLCRLTTIKDLRAAVRSSMHASLTEIFASHTYIGCVDYTRRIAAIQGGVKLFLVDYGLLTNEYFYQVGLTDFGNFGSIRFSTPLSVSELVSVAVEAEKETDNPENEGVDWESVPAVVTRQLVEKREMLAEYFCLDITAEGAVQGIPLLMMGYVPSLAKLPRFLMRLGPCVDWNDEKGCFRSFLVELASFYVPERVPNLASPPSKKTTTTTASEVVGKGKGREMERSSADPEDDVMIVENVDGKGEAEEKRDEIAVRREELARMLEHVLFPAFRARLVATRGMLKGVVEVANLKGLYKVFERC